MIRLIKRIALFLKIDTHKILFKILETNAQKVLERKITTLSDDKKNLLLEEDEKYHYGDSELDEIASQYIVRSFTIDRIQFINEYLGDCQEQIILDLGDTNGIFLRSLNKNGISVNISEQTCCYLKTKKMETVRADIQVLPFKDNSIDSIFIFETLEHVENPLLLLNEIGRVCKKSLIISIPFVSKTYINRYNYTDGRPLYQYHIFEFSPEDFKRIIRLTPFAVETDKKAVVLDEKGSFFHRIIFKLWSVLIDKDTFCGCFPKFYIVNLKKRQKEG